MNLNELLLPQDPEIAVERIEVADNQGVIKVARMGTQASCPYCGTESSRVNMQYSRKPADVPCGGNVVQVQMSVRCFFCDNDGCGHRRFAERFPQVVAPYARRTARLAAPQQQVGFAMGGEVGGRLLTLLGMPVSPDPLIRLVRCAPEPAVVTPRVLGVDDWAKKKGQSYGTILVDLEAHRVIDLREERSAAALSPWLQAHPGVEVISRDRATAYSKGATAGASAATQVADRWHLLRNLSEALERLLTEKLACLKAAAAKPLEAQAHAQASNPMPDINFSAEEDASAVAQRAALTQAERQKQARHDRKPARSALVCTLQDAGLSLREIGRRWQMS